MRLAIRLVAVATALLFAGTLFVENITAGPDIGTPAGLSMWVDLARIGVRTKIGPLNLAAPRLVAALCAADGRKALLTFESPITSERTLVLMEILATDPVSSQHRIVASADEAGPVDAASCAKVPPGPAFFGA